MIRLATYNVHGCVGTDGQLAPERIVDVLAEAAPDIIALQELDVGRARSGLQDQAREIARGLAMEWDFHAALRVDEEQYGNAILSRYPLRRMRAEALPQRRWCSAETRGALWVEITIDGQIVQVITTHLGLAGGERLRQVDALLGPDWLGAAAARGPTVLCGDMNAPTWSRPYRRTARRLNDAARAVRRRPRATFPSRFPLLRLDYVFTTQDIRALAADVPRSPTATLASDHLPLVVDFEFASE